LKQGLLDLKEPGYQSSRDRVAVFDSETAESELNGGIFCLSAIYTTFAPHKV
jgi:hypothetical protein